MRLHLRQRLSIVWLALMIILSLAAPLLVQHDPLQPVAPPLSPPSRNLPFGADNLGRDLWSRIAFGGRLTLSASCLSAVITLLFGGFFGLLAAYVEGRLERGILWFMNALLAIPGLLLAMLLITVMGPGLPTIILAVGVGGAPGFARLANSVVHSIQQSDFIEAAKALGADRGWILRYHILPNVKAHLLSFATTYYAWSFLGITTLAFLGFAGDPSIAEWGVLLNSGRSHLVDAPWLILWPGLAISLTIISVHNLGDWLASDVQFRADKLTKQC